MSLCFYIDHLQRFKVALSRQAEVFYDFSTASRSAECGGESKRTIKSLSATGQHRTAVQCSTHNRVVQFVDSFVLQLVFVLMLECCEFFNGSGASARNSSEQIKTDDESFIGGENWLSMEYLIRYWEGKPMIRKGKNSFIYNSFRSLQNALDRRALFVISFVVLRAVENVNIRLPTLTEVVVESA